MAVRFATKPGRERGDTLTIRISAKQKFALDLWARMERTTVSSVIAGILDHASEERANSPVSLAGKPCNWLQFIDEVWDVLLPDRMVKLAMVALTVLSDHEKVIWKLIQEDPNFWIKDEKRPNLPAIREAWDDLEKQADALQTKFAQ